MLNKVNSRMTFIRPFSHIKRHIASRPVPEMSRDIAQPCLRLHTIQPADASQRVQHNCLFPPNLNRQAASFFGPGLRAVATAGIASSGRCLPKYTANVIQSESPYRPEMWHCGIKTHRCCAVGTDRTARKNQNQQTVLLRERFIHRNGVQLCG